MRHLLLCVLVALAGCGSCDNGTNANNANNGANNAADAGDMSRGADANNTAPDMARPIPGLTELRIEPAQALVNDDGMDPGETAMFRATGVVNGDETDVTDQVDWTIANEELGTVDRGLFTSAGVGGKSTITAAAGDLSAEGEITVMLAAKSVDPDAPSNLDTLFPDDVTGDVIDENQLLIVYPSHETMFPRNLERATYQWAADANLDAFELRFQSALVDVRFYTDGRQYLPSPQQWRWLADSHAGSSVMLTVRGTSQADSTTIYGSQTIEIFFSRDPVLGALYYWSTGAQGVMKAHISSPTATKFYSNPELDDDTCVSCHTVARNGTKMFVNYGGEKAHEVTIPARDVLLPPTPDTPAREGGWATFNPDASRLLLASKGVLWLLDADTGAEISQVQLPEGYMASHPDWAPAGDYVVLSYGNGGIGNKAVEGTSIARIPVTGDQFGVPEVLVASTGTSDTLCFPTYSPTSEWIAFVRAEGKSKDSKSAQVFLVAADGGEPVPLTRLNERVRHEDAILEVGNSMPTWAPSTDPTQPFFLAFSSLRWYGHIRESDNDQLWGAAIDFSAIGQSDPSYAAFWMPFQDLEEGNHRAFWVIDTEEECPSDVEICDGIDNTCDGVVDENCCTIESEVCGDGVDNDCDGAVDEGCGCTYPEICDDNIDNDCDNETDGNDIDCQICASAGASCEENNDCCSRLCGAGICVVQ